MSDADPTPATSGCGRIPRPLAEPSAGSSWAGSKRSVTVAMRLGAQLPAGLAASQGVPGAEGPERGLNGSQRPRTARSELYNPARPYAVEAGCETKADRVVPRVGGVGCAVSVCSASGGHERMGSGRRRT